MNISRWIFVGNFIEILTGKSIYFQLRRKRTGSIGVRVSKRTLIHNRPTDSMYLWCSSDSVCKIDINEVGGKFEWFVLKIQVFMLQHIYGTELKNKK